jgi:fused signal recognition particle receptor
VNGVGKTTTVGKLAARYQMQGHRVLLVAADTFRAAAIEQLQAWGERLGVPVVAGTAGSSPAAAAFEGMRAASATGVDVVLVDTAGRLHTRKPLVDELRKVRRVVAEGVVGAPHETLLVLDATTGQNALSQARAFTEAVDVTGVVITKLDGTARGGMALAVAQELGLRISDIGVGEGLADLRPFSPEEFVAGLLDDDERTGAT